MTRKMTRNLLAVLAWALLWACEVQSPVIQGLDPQLDLASAQPMGTGRLDPALCSPTKHTFSLTSTNRYFPLDVGQEWIYAGEEDEEELDLEIVVLDETEVVSGVTTRVVQETEHVDGELLEISRNYFAQSDGGHICYFGEEVDIYEDGEIVSHEGAWRSDEPGHRPGIIMPANPRVGTRYQMEVAPGIAEDEGEVVAIETIGVPAGKFRRAIRVQETNPLDGGVGFKVYAPDVGMVLDGPLRLMSY